MQRIFHSISWHSGSVEPAPIELDFSTQRKSLLTPNKATQLAEKCKNRQRLRIVFFNILVLYWRALFVEWRSGALRHVPGLGNLFLSPSWLERALPPALVA
ncbi:uncharacterized protein BO88DRAFT_58086 [Aspergillus vadensis CBS 113365]|uniref:Uncharacterized protein n=1 Tax=Aspergillus vadensis (strain CBS 113365 / IMI 142717 / IBT 24658) TaxID=1448311 RepID=A0A319B9D1_ASPVC|nr:hypothetical protein BO88DRAFT_58086 [Aspergillus vadensis CBS 113365]PYH68454.1 hypothetical protein BO88DRAFT_58086 [Aspergillus vadensis CBS 113365]